MEYPKAVWASQNLRIMRSPEELMKRPIWVHGNGFIQISLNDTGNIKLHVWDWSLKLGQKVHTPIHDHRFDFESIVLIGVLDHVIYKVEPDFHGGDHWRYQVMPREGEDTGLVVAGNMLYRVTMDEEHIINAGQGYAFERFLFHESISLQPLTATVMVKSNSSPHHPPRVMVPKHLQPDNDFNRYQRPPEELWPSVLRAVWP